MLKIAINGFGRIGRAAFKVALTKQNLQVVAINDLTEAKLLAHLLKYDTVYGTHPAKISATHHQLKVDGQVIPFYQQPDPAKLPWQELGVDIVLECTGFFKTQDAAQAHLKAGAKRVIISAPAKDEVTKTLVLGTAKTSQTLKKPLRDKIISMASCTTNCVAPIIQILHDTYGVDKAIMTTAHAYTSTQNLVDGPNKDLRRARAAAANLILTTTGAAISTTQTIPQLKDKFHGIALRVPITCGSIVDLVAVLKRKQVTSDDINQAFLNAAKKPDYRRVLSVNRLPLVSSDIVGNPYSTIIDADFTQVVGGNLVKIMAWYDNEWGYSNRLVEMAQSLK